MKQRNKQQEEAKNDGIRVLIVSLFIILLAFFVVLNSIAVVDERRKLEALGSLVGSFGVLPGGLSPMMSEGGDGLMLPPQAPMVGGDESADLLGLTKRQAKPVMFRAGARGMIISIQDKVCFDEGSFRVKPSSYSFLKELCEMINQDKYPVEIIGHTDNRPPDEKSFDSNWELSALRAMEVLKFFVIMGKVDPARLAAYGCAELKPIASNETRETRAQNRRVDIVLDQRSEDRLRHIYRKTPSRFFVFKKFIFDMFD